MKKVLSFFLVAALATTVVTAQNSSVQKLSSVKTENSLKALSQVKANARGVAQNPAAASNVNVNTGKSLVLKVPAANVLWSWDIDDDPTGCWVEDDNDFWGIDGDGFKTQWYDAPRSFSIRVEPFFTGSGFDWGENYTLIGNSYFKDVNPGDSTYADNWLICPAAVLAGSGPYEFAWEAKSLTGGGNYGEDSYEIRIMTATPSQINAIVKSTALSEKQIAAMLLAGSELLFSIEAEVGWPSVLVSRKVDIPAKFAGKEVVILMRHNTPGKKQSNGSYYVGNGIVFDNLELREKAAYAVSASISNLPQVIYTYEPSWLNPHTAYTGRPDVKINSIGMSGVTNVNATLELIDGNTYNTEHSEILNFGDMASGAISTKTAATDFTLNQNAKGHYFILGVQPTQTDAETQVETPIYGAVDISTNSFAMFSGEIAGNYYLGTDAGGSYVGLDYVFPVPVTVTSMAFQLGNTEQTSVKAVIFDGVTGVKLTEATVAVTGVDWPNEFTAVFPNGGFAAAANHSYILAIEEQAGKKLSISCTGNKSKCVIAYDITDNSIIDGFAGATSYVNITPVIFANVAQTTGVAEHAVKNRTQVISTADAFELSYPADFKAVTLFDVAGKQIASYQLNASGTFSVPAASLSKGVYILKFTGTATETAKVVK